MNNTVSEGMFRKLKYSVANDYVTKNDFLEYQKDMIEYAKCDDLF